MIRFAMVAAGLALIAGGFLPGASAIAEDGTPPVATPTTSGDVTSPYVVGTAPDSLPAGEPGELAIVARRWVGGPLNTLYVAVRNNTSETLWNAVVTSVARDAGGRELATDTSFPLAPNRIEPGSVAFGDMGFVDAVMPIIPEDAEFEFSVAAETTAERDQIQQMFPQTVAVVIVAAELTGDRIAGEVRNETEEPASMAFVNAICFDAAGQPTRIFYGQTTGDELPPGATIAYRIDRVDPDACPFYLVAGYGWPAA